MSATVRFQRLGFGEAVTAGSGQVALSPHDVSVALVIDVEQDEHITSVVVMMPEEAARTALLGLTAALDPTP